MHDDRAVAGQLYISSSQFNRVEPRFDQWTFSIVCTYSVNNQTIWSMTVALEKKFLEASPIDTREIIDIVSIERSMLTTMLYEPPRVVDFCCISRHYSVNYYDRYYRSHSYHVQQSWLVCYTFRNPNWPEAPRWRNVNFTRSRFYHFTIWMVSQWS